MTTVTSGTSGTAGSGPEPALGRARRRRKPSFDAGPEPERLSFAFFFLFATLVGLAMLAFPDYVAITAIVLPLVIGSLFLGPRELPWYVVYNVVLLTLALPRVPDFNNRTVFTVGVLFLLAFVIMLTSFRRSRLGIAGTMGESMLDELQRPDPGAGTAARPAPAVARRVRDPLRGRHPLLR